MTLIALKKYIDEVERMGLDPMTVYRRGVQSYMKRSGGAYIWSLSDGGQAELLGWVTENIRAELVPGNILEFEVFNSNLRNDGNAICLIRVWCDDPRKRWRYSYRLARRFLKHGGYFFDIYGREFNFGPCSVEMIPVV